MSGLCVYAGCSSCMCGLCMVFKWSVCLRGLEVMVHVVVGIRDESVSGSGCVGEGNPSHLATS